MRKASLSILASAFLIGTGQFSLAADPGREAARPVKQAENRFSSVHAKLCNNHPLAGDLQEARRNFGKTYRKLELVRRQIKEEIEATPDVRAIDLEIRITSESIRPGDTMDQRTLVANRLLELRRSKSKLITEASQDNNNLVIAQADFEDAARQLRNVEDEYSLMLRNDPTFAAAREQLVSARRSVPVLSYAIGG